LNGFNERKKIFSSEICLRIKCSVSQNGASQAVCLSHQITTLNEPIKQADRNLSDMFRQSVEYIYTSIHADVNFGLYSTSTNVKNEV